MCKILMTILMNKTVNSFIFFVYLIRNTALPIKNHPLLRSSQRINFFGSMILVNPRHVNLVFVFLNMLFLYLLETYFYICLFE